jgi:hypothetical protein
MCVPTSETKIPTDQNLKQIQEKDIFLRFNK